MARKRVIHIRHPELDDDRWALLALVLPEPQASPLGGPKPVPNRPVVEGILWVLRNGGRWKALPDGYPAPATCWRRLAAWEESGVWAEAWRIFLGTLHERGRLDWSECFADGSFAPAKKGATASGRPRRARAPSGWSSSAARASRSASTSTPRRRPR